MLQVRVLSGVPASAFILNTTPIFPADTSHSIIDLNHMPRPSKARKRRSTKKSSSASNLQIGNGDRVPPVKNSAELSQGTRSPSPNQRYQITTATPLLRVYAFVIDVFILYAIIITTKQIFGNFLWHPQAAPQDLGIFFGYFILSTGFWGRTPGKWAAGIIVVDEEGRVPGVALAIPREVAGKAVGIAALGIGILWMFFDPKRQGWHDKISGTFVVHNPNSGIPGMLRKIYAPKIPNNKLPNDKQNTPDDKPFNHQRGELL